MSLKSTGVAAMAAVSISFAFAGLVRAQSAAPAPVQAADDPIVAIVGEERIHLSELLSVKQSLPEQYRAAPLETIYPQLLDQVVERRILANAASTEALDKEPAVARRIARAREAVLLEAYIAKHIEPLLTEEKLRERYQAQIVGQAGDEEVHARHILLESEADAKAVLQELEKGIEFTELAKKHSKGPSSSRGGDLGFFRKKDMVPEFAEVAFALEAGQISAPVKTQFGWHIILAVAKRSSEPPPFEQMAENIRREAAREAVVNMIAELRGKTNVQLFNADGTPMVVPNVIRPSK